MSFNDALIATAAAFVLAAPAGGATIVQELDSQTVRQIQQALQDKGHNVGDVDGIMGPRTQTALRRYQQAQGTQATGRVDRQTVSSLGLARGAAGAGGAGAIGSGRPDTGRTSSGMGTSGSGSSTRPGG